MFRVSISCDTHCIKINAKQLICRSQWPLRLRHGSAAACLLGLCIRIPLEEWLFVSFEWCVLSGIGLNDGLILCPEEPLSVIMCKSNSSSHVQKQLFISCAKATLHLMGKSNSSSHGQKQLFIYKSRHKRSDLERNMARNKKKAAKSLEVLISSLWQNLDIRFDQHLYLPLHTLLSQLHDHPLSHVALHRS